MVVRQVVQPCRLLHVREAGQHERRAWHLRRAQARERLLPDVPHRVEHLAVAVAVRRRVVGRAVLDDVARVVDDDVEDDFHPELVRARGEIREVPVGAEVRVDVREVEPPVAVVAAAGPLRDLVDDDGRDPDRVEAEVLDPLEAVLRIGAAAGQALKVAAVPPRRRRRVVAREVHGSLDTAGVVRRVAVRVPVGHDEVDPVGGERRILARLRELGERRPRRGRDRCDQQKSGAERYCTSAAAHRSRRRRSACARRRRRPESARSGAGTCGPGTRRRGSAGPRRSRQRSSAPRRPPRAGPRG